VTAVLVGLALLAAACTNNSDTSSPTIEREAAPQSQAQSLSIEEAGFLASGALIAILGLDADPVPTRVDSEVVLLDGQEVWQLDMTVDFTENGAPTQQRWRMWVGTLEGGDPGVLRAEAVTNGK
jgi:hypothetical protein